MLFSGLCFVVYFNWNIDEAYNILVNLLLIRRPSKNTDFEKHYEKPMGIKITGNEHIKVRRFLYKHPLFGRGDWRNEPQQIRETRSGVRWNQSVYYWWFQYLLRNDGFKEHCQNGKGDFDQLYTDFGNIHAYADDFKGWFTQYGPKLFGEQLAELKVEQLEAEADELVDDQRVIYLQIPIHQNPKRLVRQVERIIDRAQKAAERDNQNEPSTALYPIFTKPNVNALERNLKVWDMRQKGLRSTLIHEQLFGTVTDAQIRRSYDARGEGVDKGDIARIKSKRYGSVIARAQRTASLMIANVGRGVFPCSDPQ